MTTLGWVVLCCLAAYSSACSPPAWEPSTVVQKVHFFDSAVYGLVKSTTPDPNFNYGSGSTAYSAVMDVYCYLKGGGTRPAQITVIQAGEIPGICYSVELQVGKEYVVFGKFERPGELKPYDSSLEHSSTVMAQAAMACGIDPQYPQIQAAGAPIEACPMAAPANLCTAKEVPPTGPLAPPAPETTDTDHHDHADPTHDATHHDHDGDGVADHEHDEHDDCDHHDDHDDPSHDKTHHDHDGDGEADHAHAECEKHDDHEHGHHDEHDGSGSERSACHLASVLLLIGFAAVLV